MKEFLTRPREIEKRSMEIIDEMLKPVDFSSEELKVVKRVIHTTADFEYADILVFNYQPIRAAMDAIRNGGHIVTDTSMAWSGINKRVLSSYGSEVKTYMSDKAVAEEARARGITRAMVSMEHAVRDELNQIFVIGNAPTALVRLIELIKEGRANPKVVIGVPVGFVGAAESKALLEKISIPHITSRGRKGGSNVAAAIVNAILYMMEEEGC